MSSSKKNFPLVGKNLPLDDEPLAARKKKTYFRDSLRDQDTKEELERWKRKMSPSGWWNEEELIDDPD